VKAKDYNTGQDNSKEKDIRMILKTRKYYGRGRKLSIDENAKSFPNECALEHNKIFLKQQKV
jgi:hypothetical protein